MLRGGALSGGGVGLWWVVLGGVGWVVTEVLMLQYYWSVWPEILSILVVAVLLFTFLIVVSGRSNTDYITKNISTSNSHNSKVL